MRDGRLDLADLTTLRLGGPARRLIEATSEREISQIVRDRDQRHESLLILAGGSNVVVSDDGYDGTVLLVRTGGVGVDRDDDHVNVTVQAGESWDGLVQRAIADGWAGVECLSGIPGSTGATPIQNVGAYGQEVAELITAVRVLDRATGEIEVWAPDECRFGYRSSAFRHHDRWIVLAATFRLPISPLSAPIRYAELAAELDVPIGERVESSRVREAVLRLRAGKGMVLDADDRDTYSAGSFFTNPVLDAPEFQELVVRAAEAGPPPAWPGPDDTVKTSAAWLIERAGFKKGYGGQHVAISSKHTLALTNRGGGTTAELLDLAREIRAGVLRRFGVELRPEPVLVNCSL